MNVAIEILRGRPDLIDRAGSGPSWCHHQGGPWPVPHDAMVDFRSPVDGFEWLDAFVNEPPTKPSNNREAEKVVVGHADWYAGNMAVIDGQLAEPRLGARRRRRSRHRRFHSIVLCRGPDRRCRFMDPGRGRRLPTGLRGGPGGAAI
jgi:hypothetical protein